MRRLLLAALFCVGCKHAPPVAEPAPVVTGPRAIIEPAPPVQAPLRLRIIATNDFHGALEPRPDNAGAMRGGAAWVAAAIRTAESQCRQPECTTILLDGGDEFQGTAASNYVHGRSVVSVFNYLGYSAAALGNHEFDWTADTLRAIMAEAKYPFLGANVRFADGRDVPWIRNDTILRRGPFNIGIIGASTVATPITTSAENVAGLIFVDPAPIIDSIAQVQRAKGAQFIIVIAHSGASCNASACSGEIIDLAKSLKTHVDAIVSGHTHTLVNTEVNGIPIVQARSRGQAIDVVDLTLGSPASSHQVREVYTDSITPDADVKNIVAQALANLDRIAPTINQPVAQFAQTLRPGGPSPLVRLIADAMRVVGRGDLAIMNTGGVRQAIPAGTATYATLYEVQPFGDSLVRVRVKGSDLRAYFARVLGGRTPAFDVSGARIVYHLAPTPGIDSIAIMGRPLDDRATYTVVQNSFMLTDGDALGFRSAIVSTEQTHTRDLTALITYFKSLPQPVTAPADARLIIKP